MYQVSCNIAKGGAKPHHARRRGAQHAGVSGAKPKQDPGRAGGTDKHRQTADERDVEQTREPS